MKRMIAVLWVVSAALCQFAYGSVPGFVADRATVLSILGATAKTEDFENIALPPSGLLQLGSALNSNTVHLGNGPGLVIPGVTYRTPTDTQIYSPAFSGGDSQRLGFSSGSPFTFQFAPPARAVGIDLFILNGNGDNPFVTVFDSHGQQLAGFNMNFINSKTVPTFFGFENSSGIGEINIGTFIGGPNFDNVTFGAVVPEPASAPLLVIAFAALVLPKRTRK